MASGNVHRTLTYLGAAITPLLIPDRMLAASISLGFVFSLWCHPDRDQEQHAPLCWKPYAKLFRHRGVSHWPVIGTLTRLAYLTGLFWLMWVILELIIWWHAIEVRAWSLPGWVVVGSGGFVAGLVLSDCLHWLADRKVFAIKRRRWR